MRLFPLAFLLLGISTACDLQKPVPIEYGGDACAECKMTLTDRRFGGELVTSKGKSLKFDSLECLADFSKQEPLREQRKAAKAYVIDFAHPGTLIPADTARFAKAAKLRSPMASILTTK